MEFKEIVQKRYATKKFNGEMLSQEKIDEFLEIIRMSASSFGLQPWKIKIISDPETKEKLLPVSFNQPQITTCSHLLVFCANTDIAGNINKYEQMMKESGIPEEKVNMAMGMMRGFEKNLSSEGKKCWAEKQTFLAVSNAINGAKSLGFDSCPMEGFQPEEYSKLLNLPENIVPTALVTIGVAADEPHGKIRYAKEDMFF